MAVEYLRVNQDSPRAAGEGQVVDAKGTKRGELCVVSFLMEMALEGRGYQVRNGTKSTAITGDIVLTDANAEMCVDAPQGITIMPVEAMVSIEQGIKDAIEIAGKSVATASTSGSAFTPLPLYIGGTACASTARADTAGAVVVTAELATTTVRHFNTVSEFTADDGGDPHTASNPTLWQPQAPPVLNGVRCFYVQVGTVTTGSEYWAHFDFIEIPTINVS